MFGNIRVRIHLRAEQEQNNLRVRNIAAISNLRQLTYGQLRLDACTVFVGKLVQLCSGLLRDGTRDGATFGRQLQRRTPWSSVCRKNHLSNCANVISTS